MDLAVKSSDDADVGTYSIVLLVKMTLFPGVTLQNTAFSIVIRPSCRADTFTDFVWKLNNTATISEQEHIIDSQDLRFEIEANRTNSLTSDCKTLYYHIRYKNDQDKFIQMA